MDQVHQRRPPRIIVLDIDSSENYGEQEGNVGKISAVERSGAVNRRFDRLCRRWGAICYCPTHSRGQSWAETAADLANVG